MEEQQIHGADSHSECSWIGPVVVVVVDDDDDDDDEWIGGGIGYNDWQNKDCWRFYVYIYGERLASIMQEVCWQCIPWSSLLAISRAGRARLREKTEKTT